MDRYVLLYERILHGKYGQERRVYSHLEAIIYLILKASYAEHEVRTRSTGDITIRRGELLTSLESLAEAWNWSKGKVKRFLENDTDIETKTERHYTTVFLMKYDNYQSPWNENGTNSEQKRKPNGNQTETKRTRSKKGNKGNKEDIYKVFEFWNSMQMHHHLKITDEIESHVGARIDDFGIEQVCEAIKNYERILHSDNFWLTYKWTLVDFTKSMNRFEKFLTYNRPFHQYLNTKKMSEPQLDQVLQSMAGRVASPYDQHEPESVADLARQSLGLKPKEETDETSR
jgi:hypothetical protein